MLSPYMDHGLKYAGNDPSAGSCTGPFCSETSHCNAVRVRFSHLACVMRVAGHGPLDDPLPCRKGSRAATMRIDTVSLQDAKGDVRTEVA